MGAFHLASSLIYGYLCIYVAELRKLDKLSALVEILSFSKFGARSGISWMTNLIAQYTVLCCQTQDLAVQYQVSTSDDEIDCGTYLKSS